MIRAVYRSGSIQPLEAVPGTWREGEELLVQEAADVAPTLEAIDAWAADVSSATAKISDDDHDRFMAILAKVEAESKELGRRELERSP
jgi:hypothetical protein